MAISSTDQITSFPRPPSQEGTEITEHLAKLPGGSWAVWRWMGLRGAGFPVEMLLALADSRCAAAADAMNEREERKSVAHEVAIAAVQQAFCDNGRRPSPEKIVRLLNKNDLPPTLESNETARTAIAHWRQSCREFEQADKIFLDEFIAAVGHISKMIREIAGRNDFREAVAWQNRHALQTGINVLLRTEPNEARGSKLRQREQLVANYLQRYCAKNDTIGFFGPVGWARVVSDGPPIQARVGESVIAQRNLYFESWCIDSLVEHYGKHPDLLPWFAPRRTCTMHDEDGIVYMPFRKAEHLTPPEQALLAACDGRRTANRIAIEMVRNPNVAL
ncbi:MAG TPA: lantibiotic dehydratase, partial [Pyrinomonadaceae bacterium]|nr:lantibiotic dehydratase [Pyrinomonadaceae bacterium]